MPTVQVHDEVSGLGWEDTVAELSFEEYPAEERVAEAVEPEPPGEEAEPEPVAEAVEPEPASETAGEEESLDGHALEDLAAEAAAEVETHPEEGPGAEVEVEPEPPHIALEEGPTEEDAAALAAAAAVLEPPPPEQSNRPTKKVVIGDVDEFFASSEGASEQPERRSFWMELPAEERARRHRRLSAAAAVILVLLAAGVIASILAGQHTGKPSTTPPASTSSTVPGQSTTSSSLSQRALVSKASLKLDDMPSGWVAQAATAVASPFSTPASRDRFLASHPHCREIAYAFSASASPTAAVTSSYRTPNEGTPAFGEVQTSVALFSKAASVAADVARVASLETTAGLSCLSSAISQALVDSLNQGYVATAGAARVAVPKVGTGATGFAFEVSGTLSKDSVAYPFQVFVARIVSSRFEGSLLTGSIANGGPSIPLARELLRELGTRIEGLSGSA